MVSHILRKMLPRGTSASGEIGDLGDDLAVEQGTQGADAVRPGERREHARGELDREFDAVGLAARQGHDEVLREAHCGTPVRRLVDAVHGQLLAGLLERACLEEVEAVVEEREAGILARLHALGAGDDGDQPRALALGRRDEAVAGGLGHAGLDPVHARVAREEAVAVRLADVVPGELAL